MKKLIFILLFSFTLSNCSFFAVNKRSQECDKLLKESKTQLLEAVSIIDSLQMELDKCQKIKE